MSIRGQSTSRVLSTIAAVMCIAAAQPSVAQGNDLKTLPDWNDEANAYSARGLDTSNSQIHIIDGDYTATQLLSFTGISDLDNTHNDTEGDELWTAYQMYKRLDGIHQAAADAWYDRAEGLVNFFKNSYVNNAAWNLDASFNFDHLYGWGLCNWIEGESDSSGIATIDQIVSEMVSWNQSGFTRNPGDGIFDTAAGGRRWARQLRFAVCATEVSPTATNRNWRDKVIDIVLQAPDWNSEHKMYFLGPQPTNSGSRLGSGAYENGDRIAITFHMGILMDGLWHAWRVLDAEGDARASAVRQRLIDMATFYRDIQLDSNGFLQLNMGYNLNSGARISANGYGSPQGVYTIPAVNGLVMAYKLTGTQNYLNRAWELYRNWQASEAGSSATVHHFADSVIASATGFQLLANNKGELQYVYALFENNGNPTLMDGSSSPSATKPKPPVLESDPSDPVTTVSLSASSTSLDPGETTTLTWTSSGATECTAGGGWSGSRPLNGSEDTPSLTSSTLFTLNCSGSNGDASDSVTITVATEPPPPTGDLPSWYSSANDKTWINLTNAVGAMRWTDFSPESDLGWTFGSGNDHEAAIRKWNGAVAREDYYVLAFGGGHSGGSQNVVYEFGPLSSESPDWRYYGTDPDKYDEPSHNLNWGAEECNTNGYYSDGLPVSRHTYFHQAYVPDLGNGVGRAVFSAWGSAIWCPDGGTHVERPASFKFNSETGVGGNYDPQSTHPAEPNNGGVGGGAAYDPVTQLVWTVSTIRDGGHLSTYDYRSKQWTNRGSGFGVGGITGGIAIDPERRILVMHKNRGGETYLAIWDIDMASSVGGSSGNFIKAGTYSNTGWTGDAPSIVYDPVGKKFVGYRGGETVYTMTPPANYRSDGSAGSLNPNATWSWSAVSNGSGGATPPSDTDEGGLYSRFQYIASIRAFGVIVNSGSSADSSFYVYKIPQGGM